MTMDREGNTLYAGTDDGRLVRWQLDEKGDVANREVVRAFPDGRGHHGAGPGARRRVAGRGRRQGRTDHLVAGQRRRHAQAPGDSSASAARRAPSARFCPPAETSRSLSLDDGRRRASRPHDQRAALACRLRVRHRRDARCAQVALGPRGDALLGLDAAGTLTAWQIDSGCPEISFKTLFGKVLYEGYDQPEYVWQTTGGEDFEPKFSLVPLIFGTLKGTFYAMFFAVPLALFGAMYVSYFTTPGFRRTIKPVVEIMATVPSVVIGFLIALWLAPIIERWILAFFASLVAVPATFVVFMVVWQLVRRFDWAQAGGERLRVPGGAAGAAAGRRHCRVLWRRRWKRWLFRRQLPAVALPRAAGHAVRPAKQHHHRLRPGLHGDSDHLLDCRRLALERSVQHDGGVDGRRGEPLADAVARRAAVGQSRASSPR